MLTAIHFDDQARVQTHEVREIRANRMLPAELPSRQAACAEVISQALFRLRALLTQLPRPAIHQYDPAIYPYSGVDYEVAAPLFTA